ncbi:MAG: DUF58 domain-containing protein [Holophagaceae bacterium]|nr:DUF58 domain-containing protein [Holophagaceae bacterium]
MHPSRRLLFACAPWLVLGVLAVRWPGLGMVWWLVLAGLAMAALADAVLALRMEAPEAGRRVAGSLPLGAWSEVKLRLRNASHRSLNLRVHDHHPDAFDTAGLPRGLRLEPGAWAELRYQVRPLRRGRHAFGPVQAFLDSPWGFWVRDLRLGAGEEVKVYPNFAAVAKYALLATDQRLSQLGVLKKRRRGEGLEFHQLREYREGDSSRQVDWKATSRLRKLISREYQEERDQQVFFLLDCGRRMRALELDGGDGLSHFDHALNAVLLLSYVALRQGDAVGLLSFAGDKRFLRPRKSVPTLNRLLNELYDLDATTHAPDYLEAARETMVRLPKRSLVVVVSNVRDEDDQTLAPALKLLQKRHLVLLASLRERELDLALDPADQEAPRDFQAALRAGALHEYLRHRRAAFDRLRGLGVQTLDVVPARLALSLVNRYLDLKTSGRI